MIYSSEYFKEQKKIFQRGIISMRSKKKIGILISWLSGYFSWPVCLDSREWTIDLCDAGK